MKLFENNAVKGHYHEILIPMNIYDNLMSLQTAIHIFNAEVGLWEFKSKGVFRFYL